MLPPLTLIAVLPLESTAIPQDAFRTVPALPTVRLVSALESSVIMQLGADAIPLTARALTGVVPTPSRFRKNLGCGWVTTTST